MGCYPLGKIVSRVILTCNGRGRHKERIDYAMAYPPAQTCYIQPGVAQKVTITTHNHSTHMKPHKTLQTHPIQLASISFPTPTPTKTRKSKKAKHVRFTPTPAKLPPPAYPIRHVPTGPVYQTEPSPAHPVYGYRYVPSPLPLWETTPRQHEYFSGEYRYYPTPVREGIYHIATDANRLTAIFSDENPNACTIV